MKKILLQGDSITDCYRPYNDDKYLGAGYAEFVCGEIKYKYGDLYHVMNKGISGNTVVDLYARIKREIINLKPDYLSILIGVNDYLHLVESGTGVDIDIFEEVYSMLIETIMEKLPEIKIFIMEPFVFEYTLTCSTKEEPNKWQGFKTGVRERADVAKKIAEKYGIPFIPLQARLDSEVEKFGVSSLTEDGVHPTALGHRIIADAWLECFELNK